MARSLLVHRLRRNAERDRTLCTTLLLAPLLAMQLEP
jgi:hypothetical protein